MNKIIKVIIPLVAIAIVGCESYSWRANVPKEMRSVSVPVFRNESTVTELGAIVTRQILREFQREGTFKIATNGDAAIEVQGYIKSSSATVIAHNMRSDRTREVANKVIAVVSIIDKKNGKVLVDNRIYNARTTYLSSQDTMTATRDAAGRIAEDFAQQIIDDILSMKW